jgi:hypothetical protein
MSLDSLEFVMTELDQWGMRQVHGLARLDPTELVLEFRTHLLGLFRTGLKEVRIPLSDIVEAAIDYRVLYSIIRIRTRSLKSLQEIPGLKGASLKLRIEGIQSRRIARAFVAELDYQRATHDYPQQPYTEPKISDPRMPASESISQINP